MATMERRKKEKCVRVVTFADDGGKIKNFTLNVSGASNK
jgi:hypothetical protein